MLYTLGCALLSSPAISATQEFFWRDTTTGKNYIHRVVDGVKKESIYLNTVADQNWEMVGAGQFNDDLILDYLWRNKATGQNVLYLMAPEYKIQTKKTLNTVPTDWQVVQITKIDDDAYSDILWRNTSTGEMQQYLMGNAEIKQRISLPAVAVNFNLASVHQANTSQADTITYTLLALYKVWSVQLNEHSPGILSDLYANTINNLYLAGTISHDYDGFREIIDLGLISYDRAKSEVFVDGVSIDTHFLYHDDFADIDETEYKKQMCARFVEFETNHPEFTFYGNNLEPLNCASNYGYRIHGIKIKFN